MFQLEILHSALLKYMAPLLGYVLRNNERSLCKCGSFDASFFKCDQFQKRITKCMNWPYLPCKAAYQRSFPVMLKHAVAEYALWCDSVAAQIPSFYAMQRWQIPVQGDGLYAQHIWPCVWHLNCSISSVPGHIAQFLNFKQEKSSNIRERGTIVFPASEWIRQRTVWTP